MLAERFAREADRLAALAAGLTVERAQQDAVIQSQFALLDAEFVALLKSVTGQHTRLSMTSTTVTDTVTTRAFTTLAKTVTDLRSTLYGNPDRLTFTPALAFIEPGQFGVIRLDWEGRLFQPAGSGGAVLGRLLTRGILMQGLPAARLMVSDGMRSEPLTAVLLEEALARLFIRRA
jgi:hypothetical protein